MRTRKLLSGLGAAVMSLMMIIPWAGVFKEQKNSTQNTETDWVLFSCIGGGAVVVLIMIGLMAKKK